MLRNQSNSRLSGVMLSPPVLGLYTGIFVFIELSTRGLRKEASGTKLVAYCVSSTI